MKIFLVILFVALIGCNRQQYLTDLAETNPAEFCREVGKGCYVHLPPSYERYNHAVTEYNQGNAELAYSLIEDDINPRSISEKCFESYNLAGVILWKSGKPDEARRYFLMAAKANKDSALTNLRLISGNPTIDSNHLILTPRIKEFIGGYVHVPDTTIDVRVR